MRNKPCFLEMSDYSGKGSGLVTAAGHDGWMCFHPSSDCLSRCSSTNSSFTLELLLTVPAEQQLLVLHHCHFAAMLWDCCICSIVTMDFFFFFFAWPSTTILHPKRYEFVCPITFYQHVSIEVQDTCDQSLWSVKQQKKLNKLPLFEANNTWLHITSEPLDWTAPGRVALWVMQVSDFDKVEESMESERHHPWFCCTDFNPPTLPKLSIMVLELSAKCCEHRNTTI